MAVVKQLQYRGARVNITSGELGRGWLLPYRYGHDASEGGRREQEREEQVGGG